MGSEMCIRDSPLESVAGGGADRTSLLDPGGYVPLDPSTKSPDCIGPHGAQSSPRPTVAVGRCCLLLITSSTPNSATRLPPSTSKPLPRRSLRASSSGPFLCTFETKMITQHQPVNVSRQDKGGTREHGVREKGGVGAWRESERARDWDPTARRGPGRGRVREESNLTLRTWKCIT